MNILFICSRNKWRSKTAETLFDQLDGWSVKSAGTSGSAKRKVSAPLINWADKIYVMEKRHKEIMTAKFEEEMTGKHVTILDIQDDYQYNDPELIEILQDEIPTS